MQKDRTAPVTMTPHLGDNVHPVSAADQIGPRMAQARRVLTYVTKARHAPQRRAARCATEAIGLRFGTPRCDGASRDGADLALKAVS